MYGKGISREGSVLDVAVDLGIVKKSGAWYTYEGEQLGQGRENAKTFLAENAPVMIEIYDRVRRAGRDHSRPGLDTPLGHGELDADDEPVARLPPSGARHGHPGDQARCWAPVRSDGSVGRKRPPTVRHDTEPSIGIGQAPRISRSLAMRQSPGEG